MPAGRAGGRPARPAPVGSGGAPAGRVLPGGRVVHHPALRAVAWSVVVLVAVFAGAGWLAVVLAPLSAVAATQASASWRGQAGRRPIDGVAAAGAAAIVLGALGGPLGSIVALAVTVAVAAGLQPVIAARCRAGKVHATRSLGRTVAVAAACGAGGAGPVWLRTATSHGAVPVVVLCTYALVYDAAAYIVGSERWTWEGPLAGGAAIAAVTVAVAAVLVPPFRGATPWGLGAAAVVLAPLGPAVADRLVGEAEVPVPALGRIDSLIILGPVWAALALALAG